MFRRYPQPVREACLGLMIGGFIAGLLAGMGFYLRIDDGDTDKGQLIILLILVLFSVTATTAGFMLTSRMPFALQIAWGCALCLLVMTFAGTIVGIIVIKGLKSIEMEEFLEAKPKSKRKRKRKNSRKRKRTVRPRLD